MSDDTGIEWTDATWNPIRGCSRVSEGCRNCYAESVAARFSGPGMPYEGLARRTASGEARWTGQVRVVEHQLDQPLRWKRPRMIFVNSMSDLFHDEVSDETIDDIFAVMAAAPQHAFQVLTKRPERMLAYMKRVGASSPHDVVNARVFDLANTLSGAHVQWPLPNVWLGVSVENQAAADDRIPLLMQTPAAVRFLSCEPLLEMVDLMKPGPVLALERLGPIDWVIVGGESGPGARPMHPDWARLIQAQCAYAGVPFFFKQWGEHDASGRRVGKKAAGSLLDGREYKAFPREVGRG